MEMQLENRISDSQFENISTKILNLLINEVHNRINRENFGQQTVLFIGLDINEEDLLTPVIKIAINTSEESIDESEKKLFNLKNYEVIEIPLRKKPSLKDKEIINEYLIQNNKELKSSSLQILTDVTQELNIYEWNNFNTDDNFVIFITENSKTNQDLFEMSVPYFKYKKIFH